MQQIINTGKCRMLVVPVPDDAYDFSMRRNNEIIYLLRGVINPLTGSEKSVIIDIKGSKYGFVIKDWQILALAKDVTEEMAKQVCQGWGDESYTNYLNQIEVGSCYSAKLSFTSLCTAYNIQPNDLILIEKG